jgi:hypothetical protein
MYRAVLYKRLAEAGKFGAQLGAFVRRSLRGDEGTGLKRGFLEGAVEPEPELPGNLERSQGNAMVARLGVARGVTGATHLAEELGDLAWEYALVLKAAQQVILGLLRRLLQADLRRHELRQKLGELPQLEERGVRIIRKVALRKHAQALRVVLLQMGRSYC